MFGLLVWIQLLANVVDAQQNSSISSGILQEFIRTGILSGDHGKDFIFDDNIAPVVSISVLQRLADNLKCSQPCHKCLSTDRLKHYFEDKTLTSFVYISKVTILLTLEAAKQCDTSAKDTVQCHNENCVDAALNKHFRSLLDQPWQKSTQFTAQQLDIILWKIGLHYNANSSLLDLKCFNGSQVLSEASTITNTNSTIETGVIYSVIGRHLLAGNCISTDDISFVFGNLFTLYGVNTDATNTTWPQRMNKTGFLNFLGDMNSLPGQCQENEDHIHHDHSHDDHNHGHSHHVHEHEEEGHDHVHRNKRHSHHSHTEEESEDPLQSMASAKCLEWSLLFDTMDTDHTHYLNGQELFEACPTILNQWAGNFADRAKTDEHHHEYAPCGIKCDSSMKAKAYGYGTLAVAIISLCSVAGILIMPCMNSSAYKYTITALIAMGFGILTGDAILHLIPQALGLHEVFHGEHSHGEGDSGHSHSEESQFPPYIAKCIALLGAIYALFLFEGISNALLPEQHHHHHHHDDELPKTPKKYGTNGQDYNQPISLKVCSENHRAISRETLTHHTDDYITNASAEDLSTDFASKSPVICCGLKSLALVILLGDTIHNFADGLVIGAAFASGIQGGISASLAIFCHELPHEFGDFAILLSTGLSQRKALIFNLLSSFSAFGGLYIGLALGSDEVTVQWIMAVTAGMFLYVALGDMMPELRALQTKSPWLSLLLQNFGALVGLGFIILLSYYEHDIHI